MADHPIVPLFSKLIKLLQEKTLKNRNFNDKAFSDSQLRQLNVDILKLIEFSNFHKSAKRAFLASSEDIVYQLTELSTINSQSREICLGIASCKSLIDMELLVRIETERERVKKKHKKKHYKKKKSYNVAKFTSYIEEQESDSAKSDQQPNDDNSSSLSSCLENKVIKQEQVTENDNELVTTGKEQNDTFIKRILKSATETLGINNWMSNDKSNPSKFLPKSNSIIIKQKLRQQLIIIKALNNSMRHCQV
ncbi:MAG: hypothetical protein GY821_08695 [Gammaproteobacteria bacterium]|nr:hypothetical protein [Gammaproteobacteria bacterium]